MTELAEPLAIRLTVCFASAVCQGSCEVEGVRAERCEPQSWAGTVRAGIVAVLVDPGAEVLRQAQPHVVVDAIMAKENLGTSRREGSVVIALGPGFAAGRDADAVVETARGHELGRIIRQGSARENTGTPGEIAGRSGERVLRAPRAGRVSLVRHIGDLVKQGETLLLVDNAPVAAPFDGCLRGAIRDGVSVPAGMKIGDVDPRGRAEYVHAVSDKARAVGRAAVEAALQIGRERGLILLSPAR